MTRFEPSASLNAARRRRELEELGARGRADVLVIGGGITGVGVALDAASRGLRVVLAERRDLAHGTSRFSSKLAHGGLRYLATGQVSVASESARERHILALRTAPHLIHPYTQVIPFTPSVTPVQAKVQELGMVMGDGLRKAAGTPGSYLPRAGRLTALEVQDRAPCVDPLGLRGGLRSSDCQIVDDARLVIGIARTAALCGATILTRVSVSDPSGDGATLRDELTGQSMRVSARVVINATGVWAGELDPGIRLRPSRGTHLVFSRDRLDGLDVGLLAPVPGTISRFVFLLPADLDRVYLGLTDVEAGREIPDVAEPSEDEIAFLLKTINPALARPLERVDVLGTFAGLRPLVDAGDGATSDISRRHAIIPSESGMYTIVGGKLTTYRAMAQEVLDRALAERHLIARPCRTRNLPLVGAASRARIERIAAPTFGRAGLAPMASRFGTETEAVLALAEGRPDLLEPLSERISVTRAELAFSAAHEGALGVEDLLDRRTRIGLVPADRAAAAPIAADVLGEVLGTADTEPLPA